MVDMGLGNMTTDFMLLVKRVGEDFRDHKSSRGKRSQEKEGEQGESLSVREVGERIHVFYAHE